MFDRAPAPRPPTPWQADPTLFEAATVEGFAAWHIQPLQGELSDGARAALARFEAQQAALTEADAPAPAAPLPVEPFKPGLPSVVTHFVPDVHVPLGQTLRGSAAVPPPPVVQDEPFAEPALPAQAEPALPAQAESAVAEDSESALSEDEATQPEPLPDAAAEPLQASAGSDATATEPDPSCAVEMVAPPESDTAPAATEADLADDGVLAAQALAELECERAESLAAQAQPVGIDPEEAARREAEQYQIGREDGERAAREAMAQEVNAQRTVLAGVAQELHALLQDPSAFFEPLKRLAMHLAEQITLTQWQSSTQTLEALIRRCLDTLDPIHQGAVILELHPLDQQRLQAAAPALIQGMRLQADESLRMGSVRVYANDTVVEDLIEHRLSAIVRSLHIDASAWQQRSLLLREHSETALQALVLPEAPLPPDAEPPTPVEAPADPQAPSAAEDDDVHP